MEQQHIAIVSSNRHMPLTRDGTDGSELNSLNRPSLESLILKFQTFTAPLSGADPDGKLSEAPARARSASNGGVRGREPPQKFLGATPFRSSENAPFGLKLAELSK